MKHWFLIADGPGYTGFLTDFNTTFWSGALRVAEAMVAAAPFLVAGVFVAGILRGMVGADRTRKILGVGHWTGPFRAWALGILLPICSLGALPVARELRRAGVPSGTVLSFVLVAPVLNPVSIIYGLSHITPIMLVYFGVGTFVVSVGIGLIWNRVIADNQDVEPEQIERAPRDSMNRLLVVGDTAARGLVGPVFIDYGLALLAVGFLGAFLPHGILQTGLTRDNALAPIIMGLVAIPVYVTPTEVMMHFGHIVQDGYSLGAAFALILLGAGANVGVANWLRRDYGLKPLMLFVSLLIGSTLVIGITADRTLIHGNATATDHTHAFDPFTRLANVESAQANLVWVIKKVSKTMRTDEAYGLGLLLIIIFAGLILKISGKRLSVEHLLEDQQEESEESNELTNPKWDPALTPAQLVVAGACCVIGLAIVGLYLFYPSSDSLFDDMNTIRTYVYDSVKQEDVTETKRRLNQWRTHAGKLSTSVLIRTGSVSAKRRECVDEILYSLDTLEDHVASGKFQEAKSLLVYVDKVYRRCRSEFKNNP